VVERAVAWIKVPAEHRPAFEAALPRDPRVQTMQMFGGIAASVNGNMFGGLFGLSAIVRLYDDDRAEALALEGASRFDPMGNGRVSKDTIMLPEDVFHDEEQLRHWLQRALDGAAKLPPKAKKAKVALAKKAAAPNKVGKPAQVKKAAGSKRGANNAANKPPKQATKSPRR
jgi:TfoX/Sxy family transcriptional regulator of competence genes